MRQGRVSVAALHAADEDDFEPPPPVRRDGNCDAMAKEVAELARGRDPLTACRDRHQGLNEPPRPTHHETLRVLTAAF